MHFANTMKKQKCKYLLALTNETALLNSRSIPV